MSISTTTQQDQELKTAVEHELSWEPSIDAQEIGVGVHGGVVTLSGQVSSYLHKVAAGKAALRTRGATTVANDIAVHFRGDPPTDTDLAVAARAAINANSVIPRNHVKAEFRNHFASLTGEVMWDYQRRAAAKSVAAIDGVRGVNNQIRLTPRPPADSAETEGLIRRAFARDAIVDAAHVHAAVHGDRIVLTGSVASHAERRAAERAAWSSPHVNTVDNRLTIRS
ncbi:MAG: BON domain-containing protein [Actinomycetales bacterium]|nr:MAG: BON domain-containing protein [Actinomycetales bacterium]